jgi:hypothetical protein
MLGRRGKGWRGRVDGALCLPCSGNWLFPEQGKHKAPSTTPRPPLTPTIFPIILRL